MKVWEAFSHSHAQAGATTQHMHWLCPYQPHDAFLMSVSGTAIFSVFLTSNSIFWAPKNWRFWTVVLQKTLESPLDSKEIKPIKEINPEYSLEWRTDAEAEAPILWPADVKNWLIGPTV